MSRRLRLLALAPALLLAGCLPPKPPVPPGAALEIPPAFRSPAGAGELRVDWWKSFGDEALDAVVEDALAHNPDIATAAERVQQARAAEQEAGASRSVEIDADNLGGYTKQILPAVITPVAIPEATASWDLDFFHKLREADRAAKANLLASQGARDAVKLSVAGTATSAYISLLSLDARLAAIREGLRLRYLFLQTAYHRVRVGYSSELQARQAQAEYDSVAAMEPETELAIAQAENALSILTGHPPKAIPRSSVGLVALQTPAVPGGLPSALLERRPDVFAAEEAVIAADHSLNSARANMLPDFSLTGYIGEEFAQPLPHGDVEYLIANSVVGPLFDAGRRRAAADQVAAQRNQAAFAYKSTVLGALRDVDNGLVAIARDREQDQLLTAQDKVEARTLELARKRYLAGYTPYFDQVDAERQLLLADLSVVQARAAWLNAYVSLFQALGGGWRVQDVAPKPGP
jgi:outer membrane protein, multidrug efflux system